MTLDVPAVNERKSPLLGCRVVIVEDEAMVALALADILTGMGCVVVGTAARFDAAMDLIETTDFDVALLDVNLGGVRVDPIARRVIERGLPVIFVTGYGEEAFAADLKGWPVVNKPYLQPDIGIALGEACSKTARP